MVSMTNSHKHHNLLELVSSTCLYAWWRTILGNYCDSAHILTCIYTRLVILMPLEIPLLISWTNYHVLHKCKHIQMQWNFDRFIGPRSGLFSRCCVFNVHAPDLYNVSLQWTYTQWPVEIQHIHLLSFYVSSRRGFKESADMQMLCWR